MAIVIIKDKVKDEDIRKASEEYGSYIKITADIKEQIIAIGGEWHADADKKLLKLGSKQENIWGGGIDIQAKKIDYNALINIRPKNDNDSMEIIDKKIKDKFTKTVRDKFKL